MKTFSEVIAERGLKVPRYRRSFTAPRTTYTWPTNKKPARSWLKDDVELLAQMKKAAEENDTYWYVKSFCLLNNLKEC